MDTIESEKIEEGRGEIINAFESLFAERVSPGYVKRKVMRLLDWLNKRMQPMCDGKRVFDWELSAFELQRHHSGEWAPEKLRAEHAKGVEDLRLKQAALRERIAQLFIGFDDVANELDAYQCADLAMAESIGPEERYAICGKDKDLGTICFFSRFGLYVGAYTQYPLIIPKGGVLPGRVFPLDFMERQAALENRIRELENWK